MWPRLTSPGAAASLTLVLLAAAAPAAVIAAVGRVVASSTVSGHPIVVYWEETNTQRKLTLQHATDAVGSTWGTALTLDTRNMGPSMTTSSYISVEVYGSGVAAVAYTDPAGNGMRFVRATTSAGTAWGSPVSVATGREMRYNCLKIVDGVPVISYYDVTAKALYTVRAKDAAGSQWNTPTVAYGKSGQDVGRYSHLLVMAGLPVLFFQDATNTNLLFLRALNAQGTSWPTTATILDGWTTDAGAYASAAFIGGSVMVAYQEGSAVVKMVQALDSAGAVWSTPVIVYASTGDVGTQIDIGQAWGSSPWITFLDGSNKQVMVAKGAPTAAASIWDFTSSTVAAADNTYPSLLTIGTSVTSLFYRSITKTLASVTFTAPSTTPTASPTGSATPAPSITPTTSESASVSESASGTLSPTPSASLSPFESSTATPTATSDPSTTSPPSASSTVSPSSSGSTSASPSATGSPAASTTPSASTTSAPSASRTPTRTPSASYTVTESATSTATATPSASEAPSSSPSDTATPAPSLTSSPSETSSFTPSPSTSPSESPAVPDGNQGGGSPVPVADTKDDMMVGVAVGVAALAVLMLIVLVLVRRNRRARKGVYVINDRSAGGGAAALGATAPLSTVTVVDAGVLFFDETEDCGNDTTAAVGSATDAHPSSETGASDKPRRTLASFLSSKYGVTFIDPIEGAAAGLVHRESDWSTAEPAGESGPSTAPPSPPVVPGAGVAYTGSAFSTPQRHRRARRSTRASTGQLAAVGGTATAPSEPGLEETAADSPSSAGAVGASSRRRLEDKRVAARRSRLSKRLSSGPAPPNAVATEDASRSGSVSPPIGSVLV